MRKLLLPKLIILLFIISCGDKPSLVTSGVSTKENSPTFITVWKTDNPGTSNSDQITLPLVETGTYDFIVDWGDGTQDTITDWSDPAKTHTYDAPGEYTVKMTGTYSLFSFNWDSEAQKIIDITHWGKNPWASMANAFSNCSNLDITAKDAPNLSQVESLSNMFASAENFNGKIGHWDTSSVKNMEFMFSGAEFFNQDISNWDTSNVTSMRYMFSSAKAFNQDIGGWNTSKLTDTRSMFMLATAFNQDIGGWDTSNVTMMSQMFSDSNFNQDIGGWDTTSVTTMSRMFERAALFDQDISNWRTSNVSDMRFMFNGASAFNQNLIGWDTTSIINATSYSNFATGATSWTLPRPVFTP